MHKRAHYQTPTCSWQACAASFSDVLKGTELRSAVSTATSLPAAACTSADFAAAPIAGAHLAKQGNVAAGAAAGGCRLSCWRFARNLLHLTVIPAAVMLGACPQASGDQPAGGHELDRCLQLLHTIGRSAHSMAAMHLPTSSQRCAGGVGGYLLHILSYSGRPKKATCEGARMDWTSLPAAVSM